MYVCMCVCIYIYAYVTRAAFVLKMFYSINNVVLIHSIPVVLTIFLVIFTLSVCIKICGHSIFIQKSDTIYTICVTTCQLVTPYMNQAQMYIELQKGTYTCICMEQNNPSSCGCKTENETSTGNLLITATSVCSNRISGATLVPAQKAKQMKTCKHVNMQTKLRQLILVSTFHLRLRIKVQYINEQMHLEAQILIVCIHIFYMYTQLVVYIINTHNHISTRV